MVSSPTLGWSCEYLNGSIQSSFESLLDVGLGESPRLRLQHVRDLDFAHPDLIADWYEAVGKVHVVFPQQGDGEHNVVDVGEH